MAKQCIFCGGDGPFTNEHIMPEWTAKLLGLGRVSVSARKLDQPKRSWESVGSFGTTVAAVCKRCNTGWMSQLENLAKPILTRMIRPKGTVTLGSDEQVVVASWLWKLAIVHEYPSKVRYFTDDERQCLIRGDAPTPYGVHMWISAYSGSMVGNLRGGPSTFSAPDGRTVQGFLSSMTLRRFAAQILCVREMSDANISTVSRFNFTGAEVLLWPERDAALQWPPPVAALTDDLFYRWHLRWNDGDDFES